VTRSPRATSNTLNNHDVGRNYKPQSSNIIGTVLIYLLPVLLLIGFFVWMNRRAQGQMGAVMKHRPQQGQGLQSGESQDDRSPTSPATGR